MGASPWRFKSSHPHEPRFTDAPAGIDHGMSLALVFALTAGSLAAAALSIAYALARR